MANHITIIEFRPDDNLTNPGQIYSVDGFVPNLVVGQTFILDHTSMLGRREGTIGKISHVVNLNREITTYVDVINAPRQDDIPLLPLYDPVLERLLAEEEELQRERENDMNQEMAEAVEKFIETGE